MHTVYRVAPIVPAVARVACGRSVACGLVLVAGLSLLTGCQSAQPAARPKMAQDLVVSAQDELSERLDDFVVFFQSNIEAAAADIERKSPAKEHRMAAALWRVRMIEECRATANQDDPREVLVDLWTLCDRMHDFLTKGEGKTVFGPSQSMAVAASDKLNQAIDNLVRQYVPKDSLPKMKERVATYSAEHPIRGEFAAAPAERLSDSPEIGKRLGELVTLPLAPLKALEAVGRTPESVHDVSKSVYHFSEVLHDLPASARWQLQLLGMNLDESATFSSTVGSFKRLSDSSSQVADNSTRFVQVIDDMPGKVRKEAETLLKTVDQSQPQVQTTLKEAQKTATTVQGASQDLRETVAGVDRTVLDVRESAVALKHAADAVTVTAKEILKFVPSTMKDTTGQIVGSEPGARDARAALSSAAPPRKVDASDAVAATAAGEPVVRPAPDSNAPAPVGDDSFSFQAVTESANSLGSTTEKLQHLLVELRSFVESGSLSTETGAIDGHMRGAVDFSAARLRGVVDHAAKRSAQLLLLGFVLVIIYRVGVTRILRPRTSQ
jgi:hypothetical protein